VVDLVEPAKKELQWRATMVAILEDTTEENIELGNKAIAKAFENYPPKKLAPVHFALSFWIDQSYGLQTQTTTVGLLCRSRGTTSLQRRLPDICP
jgi:hypothetical protein